MTSKKSSPRLMPSHFGGDEGTASDDLSCAPLPSLPSGMPPEDQQLVQFPR